VGLILLVAVIALLFSIPCAAEQDRIDQFFYRTRYDYRRTLLEFAESSARRLTCTPCSLPLMDRLSRTLAVERMAMFCLAKAGAIYAVQSFGLSAPGNLDLSFLSVAADPQVISSSRTRTRCRARLPALSKPSPGSI